MEVYMTYITENKHKQPLNKRKQTINASSSALLPRLLCLTTVIIPQLRQQHTNQNRKH